MLTKQELFDLFVNREDVYAVKTKTGIYIPAHKNFTIENINKHLSAERCYGIYQLDTDNTVKWICVDVDVKNPSVKEEVFSLAEEFKRELPVRVFVEESNSGFHIWACYGRKVPAEHARRVAVELVARSTLPKVEIFPKQTELNENRKYGNLMNFPYATHPRTGWKNTMVEI